MDVTGLEQRIDRLEDLEAIKQLKARYCEICDDDHNPERITSIFSEDTVWEGRGIGKARGHAEIRKLFEGFQKVISYSQHMVTNPVIEVDGDSAHGTWYFFGDGLDYSVFIEGELTFSGVMIDPIIVPQFRTSRFVQVLVFILGIGTIASIYPAIRAAKINVTEAMKFDR